MTKVEDGVFTISYREDKIAADLEIIRGKEIEIIKDIPPFLAEYFSREILREAEERKQRDSSLHQSTVPLHT